MNILFIILIIIAAILVIGFVVGNLCEMLRDVDKSIRR